MEFDEDSKLIFLQRLDGFEFGPNVSPEIEEELILQPIKLLIWNQFPKYFRACLQLLSIYVSFLRIVPFLQTHVRTYLKNC